MENFLRRSEVEKLVGFSRSELYRRIKREEFPKPIHTGARAVRWALSSIEKWQRERMQETWVPHSTPRRQHEAA